MEHAVEPRLGIGACRLFAVTMYGSPVGAVKAKSDDGLRLRVVEQARVAPGGTGAAKAIGNYAGGVMVADPWKRQGFDDVVYLDARQATCVTETSGANLFAVLRNGQPRHAAARRSDHARRHARLCARRGARRARPDGRGTPAGDRRTAGRRRRSVLHRHGLDREERSRDCASRPRGPPHSTAESARSSGRSSVASRPDAATIRLDGPARSSSAEAPGRPGPCFRSDQSRQDDMDRLDDLRREIDGVDAHILDALARRRQLAGTGDRGQGRTGRAAARCPARGAAAGAAHRQRA